MNIISGKVNPSGRLPLTYPKFEDGGGAPYFHAVSDQCTSGTGTLPHWEYVPCEVQWPFGHGLSYTSFQYTLLAINSSHLKYRAPGQARRYLKDSPDTLFISVKVKNTGTMSGSETVLFFTFDEGRHTTPEYKRLRAFEKVYLAPGEEQVVTASLSISDPDFMSIGPHDDTHLVVQDGMGFWVGVGVDVDCRQAEDSAMCSEFVSVDAGGDEYISACDAACTAWEQSQCSSMYGLSTPSCWQMCTANNSSSSDAADGWGWNYVECIEAVAFDISQTADDLGDQCWKMTGLCRDIFSGAAAVPVGPDRPPALAIGTALVSGLITTIFIIFAMRGGLSRFDSQSRARGEHGDVQFSVVEDGGID
jgi:beta-glucosidase